MVYAKPPLGGPEQVLAYLGRYTHRVAIANSRLLSLADGKVRFTWKDYRQGSITKVMTLDANEFIRRFLLHALPDGFHRIRHYGFLGNGARADDIALCQRLLDGRNPTASCARSGDQTPSEQLARGPQVKTCGSFASSWLPLSQKLEPPKIPVRFGFRGLVIVFVRGCLDLPAGVNECHRLHNSYEGSPPRPCLRRCATADVKFWF